MYRNPTLFGAVYASRLIHEIDAQGGTSYAAFLKKTQRKLDLKNREHAEVLLDWLNSWNSRIKRASFPIKKLRRWHDEWRSALPRKDLADLQNSDLAALAGAYEALDKIGHIGPTIASKILFAACPRAAMMWDAPIHQLSRHADGYRGLLEQSQREARALTDAANRCDVTVQEILKAARARTFARVLDAYHWITITRRHTIPSHQEVQQWLKWIGSWRSDE